MGPGGAPYCTVADLALYVPAAMLASFPLAQQTQACLDASAVADSYLRGRYELPMLAWGTDLKRYTGYIAIYMLATTRGFNSQSGSDTLIVNRYYEAVGMPGQNGTGWFPGIQRQAIHPDVTPTIAQPGDAIHDVPQVSTSPRRGWERLGGGGTPAV